jgi:hypothetical protein
VQVSAQRNQDVEKPFETLCQMFSNAYEVLINNLSGQLVIYIYTHTHTYIYIYIYIHAYEVCAHVCVCVCVCV